MKKLLVLIFLCFTSVCVAGSNDVSTVFVASGGGTVNISDDFSGTLSNWTQDIGTWSIVTGELSSPSDAGGIISYNTSLSGLSGCAIIQRGNLVSSQFGGLGFRYLDETERSYVVRWNEAINITLRECTGVSCTNIGTALTAQISATHYFGLAWDAGTGNNINIRIWDFGATAPSNKYDSSTWGVATKIWGPDGEAITIVSPADTAANIKVYVYTGSNTVQTFDEFYASDD